MTVINCVNLCAHQLGVFQLLQHSKAGNEHLRSADSVVGLGITYCCRWGHAWTERRGKNVVHVVKSSKPLKTQLYVGLFQKMRYRLENIGIYI